MENTFSTPSADLTTAFELLEKVVSQMAKTGRSVLGAALKLQMRRASTPTFDERALGYGKFAEFLRAAERAGKVTLGESPGGDIEITLARPGQRTPPSTSSSQISVRDDLWRAFTGFSPSLVRVFNLQDGRAYSIPKFSVSGEQLSVTQIRNQLEQGSNDLVRIEPISASTLFEWMEGFAQAEGHNVQVRNALLRALAGPAPFRSFSFAARTNGVFREWATERVNRVLQVLENWFRDHQIPSPTDLFSRRPTQSSLLGKPLQVSAAPAAHLLSKNEGATGDSDLSKLLESVGAMAECVSRLVEVLKTRTR